MKATTVLKIGGSLAESDAAQRLMQGVAAQRSSRLLIVPGGGDFADAVRAAQRRHRLSDRAAHHMALLAMHLYAVMLADLAPGFVVADSLAQFESAWRERLTPIWLPAPMALAAEDIPASWDVTSDSLAAWIAHKIGAARLVLVKSCAVPVRSGDAIALAAAGVVDARFAEFADRSGCPWEMVSGVERALQALA